MGAPSVAAFFVGLVLICVPAEGRALIRMADEVLGQAEYANFNYRQHMSAAASGDEMAVRELFLFSRRTDAAGSIGHGVALVDLLQAIGEKMPARVAKTLSSDDKRRLTVMMEAGVAYGFRAAPEEWPNRYPQMAAALRSVRFSVPVLLVVGALIAFTSLLTARRRLQLKHLKDV